jgi:hypothetical protein
MNDRIKRQIINYARRLSGSWPPKQNVKKQALVAPALHRCSKCGSLNYEGESERNFQKYVEQFPNDVVNFDGIEMDHVQPVVKLSGWISWEDFFSSLFCDEDGYRALCSVCHREKSRRENSLRPSHRRRKK